MQYSLHTIYFPKAKDLETITSYKDHELHLHNGVEKMRSGITQFTAYETYAMNAYVAKCYYMCGKVTAYNFEEYARMLFEYRLRMYAGMWHGWLAEIMQCRATPIEVMARRLTMWTGKHRMLFHKHALCFLATIIVTDMTDLIATYKREIAKRERAIVNYIMNEDYCGKWTMITRTLSVVKSLKYKFRLMNAVFRMPPHLIGRKNTREFVRICVEIGYKVPYYCFSINDLIEYQSIRDICITKCRLPTCFRSYVLQCMEKHFMNSHEKMKFLKWLLNDN